MSEFNEENVAEMRGEIADLEDSSVQELPFELFEKQGNRTTKLIATSGATKPIEGRRRWHEFKFREPVLVTRVVVQVEGYDDYSEFEFTWRDESGREKDVRGRPSEGSLIFEVNDLCTNVSFRPPSVFFSKTQISKVTVEGIQRENFAGALDRLSDLTSYKTEILQEVDKATGRARSSAQEMQKLESERGNIQREITQLKAQAARLKKNIEDVSLKRNELIAKNTATEGSIEETKVRLETTQAEVSRLAKRSSSLQAEIAEAESKLKDLRSNINLFPTEIVSFVDQGSRNIRQYFWLALAPIAIILLMFVLLVRGAADLTTLITTNAEINIQALMLSRVPYVAISLAIVTACYKIARVFISEIMKINRQRLNLTKLSIVAKDVSTSAEHDLSLTDEEIYRLRAELKMEVLKDHLKEYISKDFKMELPRRILGNIPFLSDQPKSLSEEQSDGKSAED